MSAERRIFVLAHEQARQRAAQAVAEAPAGWRVTVEPPKKSRDQEDRYHAMIGDIAEQWQFMDQFWHKDDMKRLLIDLFAETMRQAGTPLHHDGRVVPSLDGKRVVQLGVQSREFWKSEASEFIEFLFAFAALHGIRLSEPLEVVARAVLIEQGGGA